MKPILIGYYYYPRDKIESEDKFKIQPTFSINCREISKPDLKKILEYIYYLITKDSVSGIFYFFFQKITTTLKVEIFNQQNIHCRT